MRSAAAHLPALALFGALALLFTWPLPQHLTTAVLGRAAGDNLAVIWNFWWARTALASADQSLFWTPDLFAPIGTSLVTHTLTPLPAGAAALLFGTADLIAVCNATWIATVFLNFAVAYAAAHAVTRDRIAAVFAAVAFGGAPFVLARLYGHLNLLSAWGLPLVLLTVLRFERKPGVATSLGLALAIGLVAYTDYYYLIFGVLLVALHLLLSFRLVRLQGRGLTSRRRGALRVTAALIALACLMLLWIHTTGGADTTVAGIRLRMTDTFNLRVALGFLLMSAWLAWKWPAVTWVAPQDPLDSRVWRLLPVAGLSTALLLSPLLILGLRLWRTGDYATQTYFWRSAPPGIDVATLLLGNPLGFAPGPLTTSVLERLQIDPMEGTAWLGLVPLALFAVAIRRLRARTDVQAYLWIAFVFFVWALGPYLRVFGANTAFMLPQTFLRFVPGMGNARIPGRAIVVVQLMIAVLGAMALASLRQQPRRRLAIGMLALIAAILECWPRPHPFLPLDRSALYASMKSMAPGIVLEIPLGVADGMAERGAIDYRVLYHQTLHEHPQTGGAISRMSPRTRTAFAADPIIGPILDLSEGRAPDSLPDTPSCRDSLACGVRYVVVAEGTASGALTAFVARSFSLQPLAQGEGRTLYRVENVPACECGSTPRP